MDPEQPTNKEIKESFDKHAAEDHIFQTSQIEVNAALKASVDALHQRLGELATKDDTEQIMRFMKSVNTGFGVIRFSWDNASKIGSFALIIFGAMLFFKFGLAGLAAWFFPPKL